MSGRSLAALFMLATIVLASPLHAVPPPRPEATPQRICLLIERHARRNGLPEAFFARLIWKESRFDPTAVSPAGAEGVAQFMPGTAALRGLADSFDIEQAIPASARYLAELKAGFGNLGLAAAAYNAGEGRVARWLGAGGFLPLETENYVLDILGESADVFADRSRQATVAALAPGKSFRQACHALPVAGAATIAMSSTVTKPWGVQLAGNFRRAAAIRQYQRVKGRLGAVLGDAEPVVSRIRTPRGRSGIHAVRIGADDRAQAEALCTRVRRAGGACIVMRNR